MIRPTTLRNPFGFLLSALLCAASLPVAAAPVKVLAPVAEVHGSATCSGGIKTQSGGLQAGDSLSEGSAIQTGGDGHVLFSPVPGMAVSEAKDTSFSVLRLAVTQNGSQVPARDAALALSLGTLSFSLERRNTGTTSLAVETPAGTMIAHGAVGTVTVAPPCVKIASMAGRVSFTPKPGFTAQRARLAEVGKAYVPLETTPSTHASKGPIEIPPGCFLKICGEGAEMEIRLINTIEKRWTTFNLDGSPLGGGIATGQDLESARGFFEASLAHSSEANSHGLSNSEGDGEIAQTLSSINRSFAEMGLPPIGNPSAGSVPRSTGTVSTPTTAAGGFTGGSLNPANTSGEVISRER